MTEPAALHQAVLDVLTALPTVAVYFGDVPATPPADDAGRVYPYAVLWGSAGAPPLERTVARAWGSELTWPARVTVAAGDPLWCLQAAHLVRSALSGLVLVPGAGPLHEPDGIGPDATAMTTDRGSKPPRFFVPLQFTCTAP